MEDVASKLGVKLTTTSSYSPHLNERNHSVVDLMITRMMCSDKNLTADMALLWVLNAKNSLENCFGFSPFQLHIGRNPVLPSATRDGPPALEQVTESKSFAAHLNALHAAKEAFVHAESSASLKKALKSKLHTRGHDITEGDWIYFKKRVQGKEVIWKGPSKVVGTNGKKLFIDQGARLGTVNRDDAVRIGEEFWNASEFHDGFSNHLPNISNSRKECSSSDSESKSERSRVESDNEEAIEEAQSEYEEDKLEIGDTKSDRDEPEEVMVSNDSENDASVGQSTEGFAYSYKGH